MKHLLLLLSILPFTVLADSDPMLRILNKSASLNDFPLTFECFSQTTIRGARAKDTKFAQIQLTNENNALVRFTHEQNHLHDLRVVAREGDLIGVGSDITQMFTQDKVREIRINFAGPEMTLIKNLKNDYTYDVHFKVSYMIEDEILRRENQAKEGVYKRSHESSEGVTCIYKAKKKKHLIHYKKFNLPFTQI